MSLFERIDRIDSFSTNSTNKTLKHELYLSMMLLLNVFKDSCFPVKYDDDPNKIVCPCNKDHCAILNIQWPQTQGQVNIYQSSRSGKRMEQLELGDEINQKQELRRFSPSASVTVDLTKKRQTILGWGGAFTDSFGENMKVLSADLQEKLLQSYFGANGLQYNFGRVPIAGTDFSARKYSYDDSEKPDYALEHWSLTEEDHQLKIPHVKRAIEITRNLNVDLKLFASPWSAPAWMKTGNSLVRSHLKPDDLTYKTYAEYLMKFYDAYKKEGINFWGATVQNEPVAANLPIYFFNSMQFTNEEMTRFIGDYLGPALEARGYTRENFKLIVGDDSLGFINHQVPEIMENEKVQRYVAGVAFHWYTSGSILSYEYLSRVYEKVKDKIEFMMMSEACEGSMPMHKKVEPGSWYRAESYALDIIEDLKRHTNAWIDWNMALDYQGGPNWSGNYVDSPILVDTEKKEFVKQPMYYSLAHFTRFFRPGSVVVETKTKNSFVGRNIKTIAVHDVKTGHAIVNVLNRSNHAKAMDITINDESGAKKKINFTVEKKSITTVVVKL